MADRLPLRDRVRDAGITVQSCTETTAPGVVPEGWQAGTRSFLVALYNRTTRRQYTVPWHIGPAARWDTEDAADVLNCLLNDASSVENADSFEEWAAEFGLDPDSRSAEDVYQDVLNAADRLRTFLGDDYRAFLRETEGL